MKKISSETIGAVDIYILDTAPGLAMPVRSVFEKYGIEAGKPVVEMTDRIIFSLGKNIEAIGLERYNVFVIIRILTAGHEPAISIKE